MSIAPRTLTASLRGPAKNLDRSLVLAVFVLIPVATIGTLGAGFRLGGWAWFVLLVVGMPALVAGHVARSALLYLLPYLAYLFYGLVSLQWTPRLAWGFKSLAQFTTFAVVYLLASRVLRRGHVELSELHRLALLAVPAIFVVAAINIVLEPEIRIFWSLGPNDRFVAIALSVVFIIGTVPASRNVLLLTGAGCLALIALSGGRMAFATVSIAVLLSPRLGIRPSARLLLFGLACVVAVLAIPTQPFQDRFFYSSGGDLSSIVEGRFNTAGRGNNWPAVVDDCNRVALKGHGLGGSADVMGRVTEADSPHPHNEFLRSYCDTGLPGAAAFWLFFAGVGYRAWRLVRVKTPSTAPATSLLLLVPLLLFSMTDNVTIYTAIYMAPAAVIFAASDVLCASSGSVPRWMSGVSQ